jgi:hypothetical protein
MKQKPLHLKKIAYNEPAFYWYELGESTYALYDSDMGEPISYGSLALVVGTIRAINREVLDRKRKKCVLWYYKRDNIQGWRKYTPPVVFNWNPDTVDKKEAVDEKKAEDTDKKTV